MSQADQSIQNDTGSSVRLDLNDNFAALFSNNSGATAPATTTAYMWWADTNNDELKIRNSTDTGFVTVGTLSATNLGLAPVASPSFTGNVSVPAGTVSSLPFRFTGDTNTGFYRNSADDFSIVTGGTRRVHFDSNGITIRDRKALRLRDTSNSNFVAIQAPSNVSSDITLTLPNSDGNADDVLQTDGSGNLSFTPLAQAVPTGSVHLMATTTAPSGYLKCNGQAVNRQTYEALFLVIGVTYGVGDNSTTFNLPDLRGEFVRGWDDGRGVDSGRNIGTSQADANKQHNHAATSAVSDPGHSHNLIGYGIEEGSNRSQLNIIDDDRKTSAQTIGGSIVGNGTGITVSTTVGNNGGSEARPRNIAMMYVIKT